jgi:class 3 adenylate cyclase
MDGNFHAFSHVASAQRIDDILNQPAGKFEEAESLPDRDRLTFTNGYYAYCSAIFVDIRDSSGLTEKYKRPVLAKIYRAFISEMVAALNGDPYVREVNIVGDCVWAVYNTPRTNDIDRVFHVASVANTLQKLLNHKLTKKGYETPLKIGIGLDYGRALMVKAGYSGSGINDVIYMGDVVNSAAHFAHRAGRSLADPIWLGETFAQNLNEHNKKLLVEHYDWQVGNYRTGDFIDVEMDEWVDNLT